ncbi:MAG TPA: CrcB family protein [Mycobacteriales bacterium]|nr:CrcB family protein [Mycobacteriales bacterium]
MTEFVGGAEVVPNLPTARPRPRPRPRLRPTVLASVFVGGFAGGLARYAVTMAWPAPASSFPWAIFLINTSGAFALALLLVLVIEILPPTTHLRPALGTGFLGAFTTFSSVVTAVDHLAAQGRANVAAVYLLASTLAGLSAASLGLVLGRAIAAYRHRPRPARR